MRMSVVIVLVVLLSAAGIVALWGRSAPVEPVMPVVAHNDALQRAIAVAESKGCRACHSMDGTAGIGPSWLDSYGGSRRFADGTVLADADENYLRESMLYPEAHVVAGYQNLMVAAVLSEQEVEMLVDLIRRLPQESAQ